MLRPHQIDSLVAGNLTLRGRLLFLLVVVKQCMIEDAIYQFKSSPQTIVVVAPRILRKAVAQSSVK